MGLKKYQEKRNPSKTPEPFSSSHRKKKSSLIFVVQKHAASHLHYDFRLQAGGVLKSWAVPKGPSMNPQEKHLAIMVEDHPYDYHDFEGIIPPGNYGAGTVMVWDTGEYFPLDEEKNLAGEKTILEGIHKGKLSFALAGKKLQGIFHLIKIKNAQAPNQWLLFKIQDDYASTKDILKEDRSVLTGRSLEEIS